MYVVFFSLAAMNTVAGYRVVLSGPPNLSFCFSPELRRQTQEPMDSHYPHAAHGWPGVWRKQSARERTVSFVQAMCGIEIEVEQQLHSIRDGEKNKQYVRQPGSTGCFREFKPWARG